jgi:hypothetical protein
MAERDALAAPLSPEDVRRILTVCSAKGILVGGQALAFWADRFAVEIPVELEPAVTADADFIGDSALAKELGRSLGWKTWLPTLDDATPQTGKVTQRLKDGRIKQVDFLSGVVGLSTKDIERRAIELEVPDIGRLRVMHPLDVLDSRIQNLHLLTEKRTPAGIAQARLAIDVVRAFIRDAVTRRGERVGLKQLERVVAIAEDIAAIRVFLQDGIDPLAAVPLESFRTTGKLHSQRWPAIQAAVARKRETASRTLKRARGR